MSAVGNVVPIRLDTDWARTVRWSYESAGLSIVLPDAITYGQADDLLWALIERLNAPRLSVVMA